MIGRDDSLLHGEYFLDKSLDERCAEKQQHGKIVHDTEVDSHVQIAQLDKKRDYFNDVERAVQSGLEVHVRDGTIAVPLFYWSKEMRSRFGPVPVLKMLTVVPNTFDEIPRNMWTLSFSILNNAVTLVSLKSKSSVF